MIWSSKVYSFYEKLHSEEKLLEIRSPCLFSLHMHEFCRKPTIFSPFCNAEGKVLGLLWCFGLWIRHTCLQRPGAGREGYILNPCAS
jgi:hypothetical protein